MKKYIFTIIAIVYIILSIYIIFFVVYSNNHKPVIKISNVSHPITNSSNIYAISYDEQIVQNLNEIKSAFFKSNYGHLSIANVSTVVSVLRNNQSGLVPLCKPLIPNASIECTPLTAVYSQIKNNINKINIDLNSPHSISNYYIVKLGSTYYFIDSNYQKTIYNNGFPVYYIK